MNKYQFKYKGKIYECIGKNKDFDIDQFNFILKEEDWPTMNNRLTNQLKWFKDCLKEVK